MWRGGCYRRRSPAAVRLSWRWRGELAQLVERDNGIVEVTGSTPVLSTTSPRSASPCASTGEQRSGIVRTAAGPGCAGPSSGRVMNWLLLFVPVAFALEHFAPERHLLVFFAAAFAIVPL